MELRYRVPLHKQDIRDSLTMFYEIASTSTPMGKVHSLSSRVIQL
jgi:hypothetical protein